MAQTQKEKLDIPYCTEFPEGLDKGKVLKIRGSVLKDGKSFTVSFLCGNEDKADNALLVLVKLDGSSEMVLNSCLKKTFGQEEKHSKLPIAKGQDFQLEFILEEGAFKVVVNEEETYQYKYRIPAEKIRFLQVEGNVELEFVRLQDEKDNQAGDKTQSSGMLHCYRPCVPYPCCPPCRPCPPCGYYGCY